MVTRAAVAAAAAAADPDAAQQVQAGQIVELVKVKNTWCAWWLCMCEPSVPAWCNSDLVTQCRACLLADRVCHSTSPSVLLEDSILTHAVCSPFFRQHWDSDGEYTVSDRGPRGEVSPVNLKGHHGT